MLERYVRYMKLERNASKNTLLAYQHDLSYLTTYCHQQEIRLVDMRLEDLERFAASLHDCGLRVRYFDHQQHSRYIILNSPIHGATHREIVLAAFVAGCHTKEDLASSDWSRYKDIVSEEDVEIVRKLGVLLRIAESLDRSGQGVVTGINCDVLGDSVIMKTEVIGDATLEINQALKANADFKRTFKKNLEIL